MIKFVTFVVTLALALALALALVPIRRESRPTVMQHTISIQRGAKAKTENASKIYCNKDSCTGPCKGFEKYYRDGFWRDYSFAIYDCPTIKFLSVVGFGSLNDNYKKLQVTFQKFEASLKQKTEQLRNLIEGKDTGEVEELEKQLHNISNELSSAQEEKLRFIDVPHSFVIAKIHELIRNCPSTYINITERSIKKEDANCNKGLDLVTADLHSVSKQINLFSALFNTYLMHQATYSLQKTKKLIED